MITLEKLTLFNINYFRKLYDKNTNSYISENGFFETYDRESFILKFIIRKQVKLFKFENEYIGYIWYQYPYNDGLSNIYSIFVKDEYVEKINKNILSDFNCNIFKFDMYENSKAQFLMNKFNFEEKSKTILMKIETSSYIKHFNKSDVHYRYFKEGRDENLRCKIQNSIFEEKDRIPLTIQDIYIEEDEDYYVKDSSIFINNDNGQPVGYGQIILDRDRFTIVNLGILSEYRKLGFGEKLVDILIGICKDNKINSVYIRVDKKNYNALALYKKMGFEEYKTFITYYKNID